MNKIDDPRIQRVLDFWFGPEDSPEWGQMRKVWWITDLAFDAEVKDALGALYEEAREGALDAWADSPKGVLALIILLDQAPRNLFRDDARAFETDGKALALTRRAAAQGLHRGLPIVVGNFYLMPFQHAEDLAAQDEGAGYFREIGEPLAMKAVDEHRSLIVRFGRFPHRNAVLGRASTPEEEAYLADKDRPAFAGGTQDMDEN
ncbi:MAG: DUF924 family protein [Rhodospirillales bacterium]